MNVFIREQISLGASVTVCVMQLWREIWKHGGAFFSSSSGYFQKKSVLSGEKMENLKPEYLRLFVDASNYFIATTIK